MLQNEKIASMSFDGGSLCLDFVNTVHSRKKNPPPDYLNILDDLLAWGERMDLMDDATMNRLQALNPAEQRVLLAEAIALRELLYSIFYAVASGGKVGERDLREFNRHLTHSLQFLELKQEADGFAEAWRFPRYDLSCIVAPVVRDALGLLLRNCQDRIRECPNCGWLFVDTSKNGRRRWCSMKACGSSVKALEYYYRKKKEKEE